MNDIIEVRPIKRQKWHNLSEKDDFARPFTIEALIDPSTHRYATGLNEADRIRLEGITGYDLSDKFDPQTPHPFWSSAAARVRLENGANLFDISIPINEIKYCLMKASKFIANSQEELEKGEFPDAKFILFDEKREVEAKAKQLEIKKQVYDLIEGMNIQQKANVIQIATGLTMSHQSNDYINVELDSLIAKLGYPKLLGILKKDKVRISVQAIVMTAVDKRVISRKGDMYFYFDQALGDMEGTIDFLLDKQNDSIKIQILEKLAKLK